MAFGGGRALTGVSGRPCQGRRLPSVPAGRPHSGGRGGTWSGGTGRESGKTTDTPAAARPPLASLP